MTVASVKCLEYWGVNPPDDDLVDAPVGATFHQIGTSIDWDKYGAQLYNWRPKKCDPADGFIYAPGAGTQADFETSNPNTVANIGTGSTPTATGAAGRPGFASMTVISAATLDRTRWFHLGGGNPVNSLVPASGKVYMFASLKFDTVPDGVDQVSMRTLGTDNLVSADSTNGVYVENNRAVFGDNNWRGKTADNGVRSVVDLGALTAPVNNTFQKVGTIINAAGTLATFLVDDVQRGTLNTNIPSAGRGFGFIDQLVKTLGNLNARVVTMDYVYFAAIFTNPR